jgi:hypothetical protein
LAHKTEMMLCFMAAAAGMELLQLHLEVVASGAAAAAVVVTLLPYREHLRMAEMAALVA